MIVEFAGRFWTKVNCDGQVVRSELGPCWEWTAYVGTHGYGMMRVPETGLPDVAHRISWRLTHGEIPDAMWVLHRCDNRRCVRPEHLFLGSNADNSADKVAKERQARGESKSRLLTEEDVIDLRSLADLGATDKALGVEFGISRKYARDIIRRERWRHVA